MDSLIIAVVGSRGLRLTPSQLGRYLPQGTTEIVSGGAKGVDTSAKVYAEKRGLKLTVFEPDYFRYGRRAPLMRNEEIVNYADMVFAFWDGISTGTRHVMGLCKRNGVILVVYRYDFEQGAFFLDESIYKCPAHFDCTEH